MFTFMTTLALSVAIVACETGTNADQDNGVWAYEWYTGESFSMTCNTSSLSVQPMEWIVWETPNHGLLNSSLDNAHFKVESKDGVTHFVLMIKKVEPAFYGVYTCHVFNSSMATRGKTTIGLNIHGVKYRDNSDKYNDNIKVAFIATAVFLVPALTMCFVFHFRYQTEEEKMRRKEKKKGVKNYAYALDEDVKPRNPDLAYDYAKGSQAKENQGFDTQL